MFKKQNAVKKPLNAYQLKRNTSKWIVNIFKFFFIAGMCYLFLFPVVYLITSALQHPSTTSDPTIIFIPTKLTLDNIKLAFERLDYLWSAGMSLIVTVCGTLATLASCATVGYGFARYKFFERNIAFMLVIILIIIPPQTTTLPTFITYQNFDPAGIISLLHKIMPGVVKDDHLVLIGSPLSMILPAIFASGIRSGLCIYIFRQFFMGQPKELEEAAKIDGCSAFGTYLRVMLPLAGPAIITVSVLSAVWYWTDTFYTNIFFFNSTAHQPLSSALSVLRESATVKSGSNVYDISQVRGLLASAALLTIVPILIAYLIVQRKFTESIERTGIVG